MHLVALSTAAARSWAPFPPLAQWLQMTASCAPAPTAIFLTSSNSASVSVVKRFTATTTGTPCLRAFSIYKIIEFYSLNFLYVVAQ